MTLPPPGPVTHPLHLTLLAAASVLMMSPAHATTSAPADAAQVRPGERLSDWLLRQPEQAAGPGLAWQVPQEVLAQQYLKDTLLVRVEASVRSATSPEEGA